jgi:hypothetical protein
LKWTKVQPSSEDLLPYSVKGVKIKIGPLDNRLGAFPTVSEMSLGVAKVLVEIALPGRDNFCTAVTLALIPVPRSSPLRHWSVPHCL